MKIKKVKIHSKDWIEKNCEKYTIHGVDIYSFHTRKENFNSNMDYLCGSIVDIIVQSNNIMMVIDDNEWIIEDWMIEKEIVDEPCEHCDPNLNFTERKPLIDNNIFVRIDELDKEDNVFTKNPHPLDESSEYVRFNYCPVCGRKL